MALQATLPELPTLPPVSESGEEMTTGQRIRRLRKDLKWTQEQLAEATGFDVATVSNVERDKPAARGERPSVPILMAALERERQRRSGEPGPRPERTIFEVLDNSGVVDSRVRRIGRAQKVRYVTAIIPDEDATPEEIQQALEEFHREQRRHDS